MKLRTGILLGALLLSSLLTQAGIQRITDGGVSINLSDLMPQGDPAILVFHVPWDQDCINLLQEIEDWSNDHPDVNIFFVDCVDPRTQVYQQFSLEKLPSIIMIGQDEQRVGGIVYSLGDLEDLLRNSGIL